MIYVWKILECQVPNFSPPIRSRTSDRRGRACIASYVGVGRLGTPAYIIALDGMPSICLTNCLYSYVIRVWVHVVNRRVFSRSNKYTF